VLGTSSQVPTRHRNHSGYLLQWDGEGILFDPGAGTQRQMIYAGVPTSRITKIMISHFHGDHCLGLAGVSQRIALDQVPHPIEVYYPASGQVFYERLRHSSIYQDNSRIVPCPLEREGVVFENDELTLEARRLDHGVETFGYRLREKDRRMMLADKLEAAGIRGPAIGELQRTGQWEADGRVVTLEEMSVPKPGQIVTFVTDTRMCEAAVELACGADLFICESTYLEQEREEARAYGHLTAAQAATIAKRAGAKKLVLTHFSQRYTKFKHFLREAGEIHPDVVAAQDCDRITISRIPKPTAK
jgi:ribonuclease Z